MKLSPRFAKYRNQRAESPAVDELIRVVAVDPSGYIRDYHSKFGWVFNFMVIQIAFSLDRVFQSLSESSQVVVCLRSLHNGY